MENKPNQHYVWQKYLEPWKKDGQIVCLRNKKKIFSSNPRNVASQKYFYKINSLTQNDCMLIRSLFINKKPEYIKKLLEGWVKPVEEFLQIYEYSSEYGEIEGSLKEYTEQALKNILEELHMKIENAGMPGLCKAQSGDVLFLSECKEMSLDDVANFLIYLCFQYFRTKKIKQNVKNNLKEYASMFANFDDAFNLLVPILSTLLGNSLFNLINNKELNCYLLENVSEIPFITGDQPVINIHATFKKYNEEATDLALYYPLSPNKSLLITKEQICDLECSIEKVKEYNDMIDSQSLELIFANVKSALHPYML